MIFAFFECMKCKIFFGKLKKVNVRLYVYSGRTTGLLDELYKQNSAI